MYLEKGCTPNWFAGAVSNFGKNIGKLRISILFYDDSTIVYFSQRNKLEIQHFLATITAKSKIITYIPFLEAN